MRTRDPGWAWTPYEPDSERPWNLPRVGHLYRRAAFGADATQLQQALSDGPQAAVDRLLEPEADVADFNRTFDRYRPSPGSGGSANELRAWWLRRMIATPHPLLEKMTLFWHGHFAVTNARVQSAQLMQRHVDNLRTFALGSFASMIEAVSQDPAVFVGLGSKANRKAQPNENLARGLIGQFGLGDGNYAEEDIHEAARALTGWFVLQSRLRYIEREHDSGMKQVLGERGNWDRDDVVRIVLAQPATPRWVIRKLYRWLISETDEPSNDLIAPLAESFQPDYDIRKLLAVMLRSNLFFSPAAYRRRIKSPVEFAVGIVRGLEAMVSTSRLGEHLAAMGQNLYHPPTVKGWAGGRAWISGLAMLARANLATALLSGAKPYGDKLNPWEVAKSHGHTTREAAARFVIDLFLQGDVDSDVADVLYATADRAGRPAAGDLPGWLRRFAHGVVTLPEFQLA